MAKTTKFYGTGRRKSSIARVYIAPGTGKITINKKDMDEYFGLDTLKVIVKQPLVATGTDGKFDVMVNVKGGGFTGQAGAIRHGISRALLEADSEEYRPILKKAGYLTRDPRMKERKNKVSGIASIAGITKGSSSCSTVLKEIIQNTIFVPWILEKSSICGIFYSSDL